MSAITVVVALVVIVSIAVEVVGVAVVAVVFLLLQINVRKSCNCCYEDPLLSKRNILVKRSHLQLRKCERERERACERV